MKEINGLLIREIIDSCFISILCDFVYKFIIIYLFDFNFIIFLMEMILVLLFWREKNDCFNVGGDYGDWVMLYFVIIGM